MTEDGRPMVEISDFACLQQAGIADFASQEKSCGFPTYVCLGGLREGRFKCKASGKLLMENEFFCGDLRILSAPICEKLLSSDLVHGWQEFQNMG